MATMEREAAGEGTAGVPTRERSYTWADPLVGAQAARGMSGLEYLQAIKRGEFSKPPIMETLGIDGAEFGEGFAVFTVTPAEYHYNPIGVVHGGLAATLCDSAMGCAIHSTLPAGAGYTTLELKLNFIRALTAGTGRVRAEAKVIHTGGRTAIAEARVLDDEGRLYAHATTTCMIFRP